MSSSGIAFRAGKVVLRTLDGLSLHPATALVPPAPTALAPDRRWAEMTPLQILADGQVLIGRDRYEQARIARRRRVRTVIVTVPDDRVEMYVLDDALESQYLTDDQRACLAVEYAGRLSARLRKERASRAAAARYGTGPCRTTGAGKQDARAEACKRFRIPPKRFRQVRKLLNEHPQLYKQVMSGAIPLKGARDKLVKERIAREEIERCAAAPTAALDGMVLGDALEIIPSLRDDHFTAMITDPPYGVNFRQEWRGAAEIAVTGDRDVQEAIELFRRVLIAADAKLRRDAFLLSFAPAKYEPEFRATISRAGWTIIGYLIWVKNTRVLFPHLNLASRHERLILAVRGNAKLRRPISDVFGHGKTHASSHPCEKPIRLLAKFVEALTVEGEAVLDPFAGSGSTVVASRRLNRQALGIEINPTWYHEAIQRLQR